MTDHSPDPVAQPQKDEKTLGGVSPTADDAASVLSSSTAASHVAPVRIWALHCPFNKTGFPVLGSFGSRVRGVIIIPVETWTALCQRIPELAATQFEVGERE